MPSQPTKYRKRPVEVEAMQWIGENREECLAFTGRNFLWLHIGTGDWIVKDLAGTFSTCSPDIFEATYEPIPLQGEGQA